MQIGEKIRRIRELLGISKETLAFRIGVGVVAIEKVEATTDTIGKQPLERIAKALEITVDDIKKFNDNTILITVGRHWNEGEDNKRIIHLLEEMLLHERHKVSLLESLVVKLQLKMSVSQPGGNLKDQESQELVT